MLSQIDPTKAGDGVPAIKANLRGNLQAAKDEMEALQTGKSDLGHSHMLSEITDAGALAELNQVGTAEIAAAPVNEAKIAADAIGAAQLQNAIPFDMQGALLSGAELIDYADTSAMAVVSASALTPDRETGNALDVALTEDVTSLNMANPPAAGSASFVSSILRRDVTGGWAPAWLSSSRAGRTGLLFTPAANVMDIYSFGTRDDGATWYGFPGGRDFS